MMTLFIDKQSLCGYKICILARLLHLPMMITVVDTEAGFTVPSDFPFKPNAFQLPSLRIENGTYLSDANAILFYLAEGSYFLPSDPLGRAQVMQWVAEEPREKVSHCVTNQCEYQMKLESHLEKHAFLVGLQFSIADISTYASLQSQQEELPLRLSLWMRRLQDIPEFLSFSQWQAWLKDKS